MPVRGTVVGWGTSIAYFVVVGCLFLSAAFVSLERHPFVQRRLIARPGGILGVTDVLLRARAGEVGDVGLALLVALGPVGGTFRGSILLAAVGVLLLLTALLQYRRLRLGAVVGIAWGLSIIDLLLVTMGQISVPYSLAARLLMFGPAFALTFGLLLVLGRSSAFFHQP